MLAAAMKRAPLKAVLRVPIGAAGASNHMIRPPSASPSAVPLAPHVQAALDLFTAKDSIDDFQRFDNLYDMAATVALAKVRCACSACCACQGTWHASSRQSS